MSVSVRPATTNDVPWLLVQLQSFADFFGSKHSLFPTDYADTIVAQMVQQHPFWIAERFTGTQYEAVGFIAGVLAPHPYNPAIRVLSETFWWVDEAHRGTRAGALLFSAFLDYGETNADWIVMTLEEASQVKPDSLERRGFRAFERSYLREVVS